MKRVIAATIAATSLACSGSSPTASVYGAVSGNITDASGDELVFPTISDASAVSYAGATCTGSGTETELAVYLSSAPGACAAINSQAGIANSEALLVAIVGSPPQSGGVAPVVGAASYPIGSEETDAQGNIYAVNVVLAVFDGSCGQSDYFATSGTVVISSISSAGEVQGSFAANFDNNDGMLSGTFDAPSCSVPAADHCSTGTTACNP